MSDDLELDQLRRERDLYLRLLQLGRQKDIARFLDEALALVVEISDAEQGYLELRDRRHEDRVWSISSGMSDQRVDEVRTAISSGIIAAALSSGETVITDSALTDQRFSGQESVIFGRIKAVLCAPVGGGEPFGVVYLQGSGIFSSEDVAHAEMFALHLAPQANRILRDQETEQAEDPTREFRAKLDADALIGRSKAFAGMLQNVALVAPLNVGVLLTGPTGSGKTEVARCIHASSPRAKQPFVELNCAAIPENLLESELFGHEKGAFTGADKAKEGKVAAAEGGTLFLDEIGELPLASQAKVLHLLQSKTYYPIGNNKPKTADIRVIAATNADLEQQIAEKSFREDLYYRLQVMPVRLPGLAERRSDIAPLTRYFCDGMCARHDLPQLTLSPGALRAAEHAEWPGNIRQLAHAIEAAVRRAPRLRRAICFRAVPRTMRWSPANNRRFKRRPDCFRKICYQVLWRRATGTFPRPRANSTCTALPFTT